MATHGTERGQGRLQAPAVGEYAALFDEVAEAADGAQARAHLLSGGDTLEHKPSIPPRTLADDVGELVDPSPS